MVSNQTLRVWDRIERVMSSQWTTGFLLILIAWSSIALISGMNFRDLPSAGQSGDSFGVLNGLFGGMTLLGVAYGVSLERRQLRLARKEARDSGEERRRSLEIQLATAELNTLSALAAALSDDLSRHRAEANLPGGANLLEMDQIVAHRESALLECRVILFDIRTPKFDWKSVPERERSRTLKYFMQSCRNFLARFRILRRYPNSYKDIVNMIGIISKRIILLSGLEEILLSDYFRDYRNTVSMAYEFQKAIAKSDGLNDFLMDDFESFLGRLADRGPVPETPGPEPEPS